MNKWIKYLLVFLGLILALPVILFIYLASFTGIDPPDVSNYIVTTEQPSVADSTSATLGNNWIRKSDSGLWELYVEGNPYQRGIVNGRLAGMLVREQEEAFSEQISKMIPSGFYRNFLRYFIAWFNRDLAENVPEEYKVEIYGVSQSASDEFNYIGSPYERILNYHAAHDIGHALQNLALVGCSSFGTWGEKTPDGKLIVGRNFDFYVGDRFAENKIVMFCKPDSGYPFMSVTWGGMIGVVSGMNTAGITITLNAAKSEIPRGSATPVSILAREILQYAGNIQEAYAIALNRKTFVAESFLIGSAVDNKAVNIEITPDTIAIYDPEQNEIVCTNHYESDLLGNSESNRMHMQESASVYRNKRLKQLIDSAVVINHLNAAEILRDQSGINGTFIGYGNEKAVNQLISHHSVIFQPADKMVWISTGPWQLGSFVAYNLDSIFSASSPDITNDKNISQLTIPSDPFVTSPEFLDFLDFRKMKAEALEGRDIDPEKVANSNPGYYHAWVLSGDQYFKSGDFTNAKAAYSKALQLEIASVPEKRYIKSRLAEIEKK